MKTCKICGTKLKRFAERRQTYYCSLNCAKIGKLKNIRKWEKKNREKMLEYKRKYNRKKSNENKKIKTRVFQEVSK